tara:strand:+ start:1055 stop:1357 length:303 start_codon:yes stop_codon:yes gene_type:complete
MTKYNLTAGQQDELISAYAELIVDSMDNKTMEEFVYQTLIQDYSNLSHDELLEDIELTMCDVVLEELIDNIGDVEVVDNNSTHTYSLNDNESISFPVHKK